MSWSSRPVSRDDRPGKGPNRHGLACMGACLESISSLDVPA